jgi:hypothetical protein
MARVLFLVICQFWRFEETYITHTLSFKKLVLVVRSLKQLLLLNVANGIANGEIGRVVDVHESPLPNPELQMADVM